MTNSTITLTKAFETPNRHWWKIYKLASKTKDPLIRERLQKIACVKFQKCKTMKNLIGQYIKWNRKSFQIVSVSAGELQVWHEETDMIYKFKFSELPGSIQKQLNILNNGDREEFYSE